MLLSNCCLHLIRIIINKWELFRENISQNEDHISLESWCWLSLSELMFTSLSWRKKSDATWHLSSTSTFVINCICNCIRAMLPRITSLACKSEQSLNPRRESQQRLLRSCGPLRVPRWSALLTSLMTLSLISPWGWGWWSWWIALSSMDESLWNLPEKKNPKSYNLSHFPRPELCLILHLIL